MGLLSWLFPKPARKRRRAGAKKATKKVCPKRTPSGKKVFRGKGTCFTKKRVAKVAKKG